VFPNAIVENVLSPNVIENMCFRDFENIFSCLIDNINPGVLGSGKYTQEISIRSGNKAGGIEPPSVGG
jgi:hypothetical protein